MTCSLICICLVSTIHISKRIDQYAVLHLMKHARDYGLDLVYQCVSLESNVIQAPPTFICSELWYVHFSLYVNSSPAWWLWKKRSLSCIFGFLRSIQLEYNRSTPSNICSICTAPLHELWRLYPIILIILGLDKNLLRKVSCMRNMIAAAFGELNRHTRESNSEVPSYVDVRKWSKYGDLAITPKLGHYLFKPNMS